MVHILGIDPGLRRTGWGVVRYHHGHLSYIASGAVCPPVSLPIADRLLALHREIEHVVTLYKPQTTAIEESFVNTNAASTLRLGNARGALILSLAQAGLDVHEYAATQVKKSVVGVGRAQKGQVGMMVRTLLPACDATSEDALDALAVAICHAHLHTFNRLVEAG